MPTMRRSARVRPESSRKEDGVAAVNGTETPVRGRRGRGLRAKEASPGRGAAWSGSSSPLSSLSTPASGAVQGRGRQRARGRGAGVQQRLDSEGSGEEEDVAAVSSLLTQAAAAIRDEVGESQLAGDEDNGDDEQADDGSGRSTRSRAGPSGKRRRRASSQASVSVAKRRSTRGAAESSGAVDGEEGGAAPAKTRAGANGWGAGGQQPVEDDGAAGQTPGRGRRAKGNGVKGGESSDDGEAEKDPAGEKKIDADGYLQGGREFICPIFRSPFRRNTQRQYVLTMDCCRYMGARDSYMLFKQHPRMQRVETTQEERDLLADRMMIPKVTRFRPIALITARTAYREFGARIVKNGKYIVDDYWEDAMRREARHPEGTLVANMEVYHSVAAAQAAGMTPGSTRKARKSNTPHRSSLDSPHLGARVVTPTRAMSALGSPTPNGGGGGGMVGGWAQLEAQQRMHRQNGLQPSASSVAQLRPGGLTMANALQHQHNAAAAAAASAINQGSQMQLLQQAAAVESDPDDTTKISLGKPVFRKMRAPETADAAFEAAASAHKAQSSDDLGFVDGIPLVRSLASSWSRSGPSKARVKRGVSGTVPLSHTASANGTDSETQEGDDVLGAMAYASGKMAREFNSSVRLWREDNGCTWVDPHTGIRQVPASLQPTTARMERVDGRDSRWQRSGKTRIEPLVSFSGGVHDSDDGGGGGGDGPSDVGKYPLALLPGQFQGSFPVHRTRFGQTYQQMMHSYSYYWMRQLATQRRMLAQQQQHANKRRA
ncbi:hypothetical protein GGF46_002231 [Coemansia sp. RSA 552]|nr:hypothetical protein GGF46_002231 [Coemansia sp. RSA 552]